MMHALENLLSQLDHLGIRLSLDDGRLGIDAPKGALTEELRTALVQHKDLLLTMLGRASHSQKNIAHIAPNPQERFEPFPLIDVQHAYWIGRQSLVESGGVSTHLYLELESTGLDLDRLNTSLQKVIERHDMLRVTIQPDGQQRILKTTPAYRIQAQDLRGQAVARQDAAMEHVRQRMSHQVLPADQWPLFEFSASLLDGDRIRLHCSLDMLILDAWSMFLLFGEWKQFYDEPDLALAALEFSYRDYVLAEQALQGTDKFKRAEKYWLDRLDSLPSAPDLPLATQPEKLGRSRFTRRRGSLSKPRWELLKQKAQRRGLTPSALLAAAFGEVLRLWAKEPDFTLNVTLYNRLPFHAQVNEVIGDFTSVNLLSMPVVAGEDFTERAARLQRQLSEDLEHLHYNGVRVLRERARRLGSGPRAAMPIVFTSALVLGSQGYDGSTLSLFGEYKYGISQTPQVWLDHQVAEQNRELIFNWDVVDGLFPEGMIDDMFESFRDLLDGLADHDALWVQSSCAAQLPPCQKEALLAFNATTEEDIAQTTLHELVAHHARKQPDAMAVIADNGSLTYGELTQHANRLGRYLRAKGASKNTLVAIVMEKGWEQAVGVLGILHAGAAYLPIDPELPQERRWNLLKQAEAAIVVTQPQLRTLVWPAGTTIVTPDDAEVASQDPGPLAFVQTPDDLAYVLFTSGSTGEPKGAMIDHRGAANTVQDINRRFRVNQHDRVLALSALNFDLSVYDLFGVLGAGGAVVLPAAHKQRDPFHWSQLISQHRITLWNSVPQLLQIWVEQMQSSASMAGSSLRHVQLSGDWIPVKLPDQLRSVCPGVHVVSLGGPTEASIWQAGYSIGTVDPQWKSIPYGRPLANQRLYLYNALLEPRASWAVGEIYIGGFGVGKGYWHDEVRTAERFITHPQTGERLYKSGDLARYLPSGVLEILGREDFQVKINGYRIELGEIAAHLHRQATVQDALVDVAVHPDTKQKHLVAYVVPKAGGIETTHGDPASESDWATMCHRGNAMAVAGQQRDQVELEAFGTLWQQMDALCPAIMARTLVQLGVFREVGQVETARSIIAKCAIDEGHLALIVQWLKNLTQAGFLAAEEGDTYRCIATLHNEQLEAQIELGLSTIQTDEPYKALFDYIKQCARQQPELLQGKVKPLELLFPDGEPHVADALYQTNPVNVVLNQVAAFVLRQFVDSRPSDQQLRVLEVGAGTGATTVALLPVLPQERTRYRFTDVSGFFLDRARERFSHLPFIDYGLLNVDENPSRQGYASHSFDVVVAVNVLHDAVDVDRTLASLRKLLTAEGILLLVEGTSNSRVQMITVGLLESFGRFKDRRQLTGLPLMSTDEWQASLIDAGYTRFAAFPGDGGAFKGLPQHVMVAQGPSGVHQFDLAALTEKLAESLPGYMLPQHTIVLDALPLSANGKLDHKALPSPWRAGATSSRKTAPRNDVERQLVTIWRNMLNVPECGIEEDFYDLGGDSLIAVSVVAQVQKHFQLNDDEQASILKYLFEHPTIAQLAEFIASATQDATDNAEIIL